MYVGVRSCENLPVRGDFRARAHGAASAGSFVQFDVARSVAISHALERGLRVAARFPGRVLRHDIIAAMRGRCMYCRSIGGRHVGVDAISRN